MQTKIYILLKDQPGQDAFGQFFDNNITGTLTTDHAASSYGQPVIISEGKLIDYSEIASLTLPYGTSDAILATARNLESFGIRVSRTATAPEQATA